MFRIDFGTRYIKSSFLNIYFPYRLDYVAENLSHKKRKTNNHGVDSKEGSFFFKRFNQVKTHREKWRIRFTGGDIILALFATNVGIDREAQTSRISPDSDRSPRVVDDFQLSRRGTRREKREKRMEGSVHAAHTRALLLFTGIGARVRAGIIAPVVRCLSFVIVRGPFVVNARERLVHMVIRRGGRVTSNVHARARTITTRLHGYSIFQNAYPEWQDGVKT